ncbi:MAG: aldehyde dehydrogenase family protein [Candidatus Thorarchaeota archaeon]
MSLYPILVDSHTVDTGNYVRFPDMDAVVADPGLAIALQLQEASTFERLAFTKLPWLIPSNQGAMRYLRDYRKHHGVPEYSKDELEEVMYAQVCLSREKDIDEALGVGVRDHKQLFNPLKTSGNGLTIEDRVEGLYKAGLDVKERFQEVREVSIKEGVPIKTFEWTWDMFTEYLERETFEIWAEQLDIQEDPGRDGGNNYRFREPYGVACLFTPYNSPLALGILSITSSILAGNATIIKPPSKVPLSTILLGRVFMNRFLEMGFPKAMVQVLTGGGKELMKRFMDDSRTSAIVWYGDSDTGIQLWSKALSRRIQMAPELAGSDACLVWGRDVDLDFAARMIVKGRYLGSGQACMAIKRLLVQEDLHDDLVERVVEEARKLNVGRPSNPETDLPPLGINALYGLLNQMKDARAKGAEVVTGGRRLNYLSEEDPAGLFYEPTVLTNVKQDMAIMREEVFAPALPVLSVSSVDQAISIANASRFGLRSSVFTEDESVIQKWTKGIEAAGVTINQDHLYFDPHMPHLGGYKDSGIIGGKFFPVMLSRMKYVHSGPNSPNL